jgi:hypothetical protein
MATDEWVSFNALLMEHQYQRGRKDGRRRRRRRRKRKRRRKVNTTIGSNHAR